MQIEPVGQCNLRCRMCAIQFREDGPPHGLAFMPFDDFKRLVLEFGEIEELQLQGLGEPTMHPHFFDMVAWASARGIRVSTNSLAREHEVQVIHAHMGPAHVIAGLAGRATRTPVLATVHSMHLSMLDLEVHRLAATHICVVSEAARAHALAVGAASARLSVIRNGVDADEFTPRSSRYRADGDPLTVGFVGRLSAEKNPELFLRTAALVHASIPSARFVVIGDGPLRAELHALARALRITDVITFAGECDSMPERYHALDVVLCTSWHEGTPLAVLEAMASGLPVVATDIGGNPELVAAGLTGWLTPPGDELVMAERTVSLLADEAMRARFGAAARSRVVRQFSVGDYIARTAALLEEVAYSAVKPRAPAVRPLYGASRASLPAAT